MIYSFLQRHKNAPFGLFMYLFVFVILFFNWNTNIRLEEEENTEMGVTFFKVEEKLRQ